jgi:hypothetical protein
VLTLPLPTACPELCINLLSLPSPCLFTWRLGGGWLDLACGILGVWALGPNVSLSLIKHILVLHTYNPNVPEVEAVGSLLRPAWATQ